MASLEDVLLPDIGDFAEVEIIEILVAPGDRIEPEQSILTLESDKATLEIPAPLGGTVQELAVAVGDKVAKGALLMRVATEAPAAAPEAASDAASPSPTSAPAASTAPVAAGSAASPPDASPDTSPDSSPAAGSSAEIEVHLPDVGDFKDIPVIEVLVGVGDQVEPEQSILTLESDKATMEIPSPAAGTVASLAVAVGDKLNQGDLLLTLHGSERATTASPPAAQAPPAAAGRDAADSGAGDPGASPRVPGEATQRKAPVLPRPADLQAVRPGQRPHASPAVRRFARELGVDLGQVKGSGRKGRILREDVQAYVKQTLAAGAAPAPAGLPFQLPAPPEVDFARFGAVETQPLARIRRISGAHLHRCWLSVPHVTQFDEADITELEAFRKAQGERARQAEVKLTLLTFLLKAVAAALAQMPQLKASLAADGEHLILKQYTHIGVAVDTPNGLVVPVLRDVDRKGLFDLARELAEVSAKARAGKLLPGDMQGGVFTISSLGGIGGTAFTPIVNAPEVAILGVSRAAMQPVWDGSAFQPRLLLPLSLSYDHRVVDGAEGARFTSLLAGLLGDIRRLLL
ncbi:MAG: dihydrolipoyllysine-residue acetyltransferase [Chromatiaceae bacterium]|nr:MAG: dihydrolipoyllysine-residue acetyltransferase [Chromatiaceae bacterium]